MVQKHRGGAVVVSLFISFSQESCNFTPGVHQLLDTQFCMSHKFSAHRRLAVAARLTQKPFIGLIRLAWHGANFGGKGLRTRVLPPRILTQPKLAVWLKSQTSTPDTPAMTSSIQVRTHSAREEQPQECIGLGLGRRLCSVDAAKVKERLQNAITEGEGPLQCRCLLCWPKTVGIVLPTRCCTIQNTLWPIGGVQIHPKRGVRRGV